MAEINYMKQKENEQKHIKQKQRESSIYELRQKQDEYKERLLDYKISEQQAQYLQDHPKYTNTVQDNSYKGLYESQQKQIPSFLQFQGSVKREKAGSEQKQNYSSSFYSGNVNQYEDDIGRNISQLPLSQSFRSSNANSSQLNQKNERDRISFRTKSNALNQLSNISTTSSTTVKLVPLSNKIKNESFRSNAPMQKSIHQVEHNTPIDEDYEQDYTKLIIQAKYLISQNNLKEAESLLENLILKIPFHCDCLYLLGDAKRIIGKYRESEILLKKCMQQENYTPFVYKSLAETYFVQYKYQDSAFYFKKYLLFKKDDDEALSLLGQCLLKLGEHLEASACFNKSLEINQDKLEYYLHRSEVNDLLGLRELSQRDYIYFKQNKSDYLQKLSELSQKQKVNGKILESQKTLTLLQNLIPIN